MAGARKTQGIPWERPSKAIPRRKVSRDEMDLRDLNIGRTTPPHVKREQSFIKRQKLPVLGLAFAGGAASAHYIDDFRFYPMADKVPPPALASILLIVGGVLLNEFTKKRELAQIMATLGAGVGSGGIYKAITKAKAGGT